MSLHLGIALALACALTTHLAFLYRHRAANAAPAVARAWARRTITTA